MINSKLSCHFSKICKCYSTNFKLLNFSFKEPCVFWAGCDSVLMKHLACEPKDPGLVLRAHRGGRRKPALQSCLLPSHVYLHRQTSGTIRTYFFKEHIFFFVCICMYSQKLDSHVKILSKTFGILLIIFLAKCIFLLSHHIKYER